MFNFHPSGPVYFLFCHAIELALKAYVLATGGNRKELMPIRHDLQKLYDLATERGYKSSDPRIPEVVGWLEPHHSDFSFRYKEKTGPPLPNFQQGHLACGVSFSLLGQRTRKFQNLADEAVELRRADGFGVGVYAERLREEMDRRRLLFTPIEWPC